MPIQRVVPNISSERMDETQEFYIQLFGFEVAMDMGWILTLASPSNPSAQISVFRDTVSAAEVPALSIEVDDVDVVHEMATERGLQIVYPLTDEEWGVRRFFLVDPNGIVINVLSHVR
jgi:predicted enzyme related to lactoylglutathione lyase